MRVRSCIVSCVSCVCHRWGTDANGVAYWLIANSWDTWWADAGYFRIKRGVNLCGIENYVSAPVIARTAKRFGGVTVVDERDFSSSSSFNTGQAVTVDSSNEFVQRSSQVPHACAHHRTHHRTR